jgi:hypothetical protein
MERDAAIELAGQVVENLANTLLTWKQAASIERDDLVSVGMIEAIRTVDRDLGRADSTHFPLDKQIARNAKTVMLRFIRGEKREARYRQHGNAKAIRDTDPGTLAGDVDGGDETTPAKIPLSARNRDFPNTDEFVYRGWLRGSIQMGQDGCGYFFKDPGEIPGCPHCGTVHPWQRSRPGPKQIHRCGACALFAPWIPEPPERDFWGYLIDPDEKRERERAGRETVVRALEAADRTRGYANKI